MTQHQLQQSEADDVRISAYYDEHGRATNVDVMMNLDEITPDGINSIVANLRLMPGNSKPEPVAVHVADRPAPFLFDGQPTTTMSSISTSNGI